jgi:hypothetical protein
MFGIACPSTTNEFLSHHVSWSRQAHVPIFAHICRWGFRQVDKNVTGVMVFMHPSFSRGDKRRCLMMRSVVNKSNAAASSPVVNGSDQLPYVGKGIVTGGTADLSGMNVNAIQALIAQNGNGDGLNVNQLLALQMNPNLMQMLAANQHLTQHMPNSQFVGSQFFPNNGLQGQGMDNAFQGSLFNSMAFSGINHLYQQQQQQQSMQLVNNSANPSSSVSLPVQSQQSNNSNQAAEATGSSISFLSGSNNQIANSSGNNNNANNSLDMMHQQVALASQIMRQNPSIEPLAALELAKGMSQHKK